MAPGRMESSSRMINCPMDRPDENDIDWNAHLEAPMPHGRSEHELIGATDIAPQPGGALCLHRIGRRKTKWGNPDLAPEQSTMIEYGFNWTSKELIWSVAAYYNRLDDLIADKVVNSNTSSTPTSRKPRYTVPRLKPLFCHRDWQTYGNLAVPGRDIKTDDNLPNIAPVNGWRYPL